MLQFPRPLKKKATSNSVFLSGQKEDSSVKYLKNDLKMLNQIIESVDNEQASKTGELPIKRKFTVSDAGFNSDAIAETMKRYRNMEWQLCPHSVDRLECFESYMSLYLDMVGDKQGKRTYIGKRSSGDEVTTFREEEPISVDNRLNGRKVVSIFDILRGKGPMKAEVSENRYDDNETRDVLSEDQIRLMCAGPHEEFCVKVQLEKAMKKLAEELKGSGRATLDNQMRKRGLCDGVSDTVSCFDHYLGMYASMQPSKGGANQFVGRRNQFVG